MTKVFKVEQSGIPVDIESIQPDSTIETVHLLLRTDETSLLELAGKAKGVQQEIENLAKDYPILNKNIADFDDESIKDYSELFNVLGQSLKINYDNLFGEGTYDKLRAANLSRIQLFSILPDVNEYLTDELKKRSMQEEKRAKQKMDKYLKKAHR
ncbi:hypothetical protein [Lacticaseibacillus saniviri]|uniref:hypothetical protein n=1 Tax=Lacticaseibacillus saniviri TaxID=931533 RepID=UPI001EDC9364|nr:hypothetical protein [Lacticaseibacillus saniviri]MCG4280858.1 hypothetical protein [Lacticaseibacillus saniviri]